MTEDTTAAIVEEKQEPLVATTNPFSDESWSETPPEIVEEVKPETEKKEEVKPEVKAEEKPVVVEEKKVVVEKPVVEEKKIEEPKKGSKYLDLIYSGKEEDAWKYLNTKKELSSVDSLTPEEVIKLNIRLSNEDFKPIDIDDVFEEKYAIPEKPEQGFDELDEDFQAREAKWETSKAKVERRIERDAKAAKAELAKINTELVPPEPIKVENTDNTESQEELAKVKLVRENFEKALAADYKNFDGYKTEATYKDEGVDVQIPVQYAPTDEQKEALKAKVNDLIIDDYFGQRWFTKDGNVEPNVSQIMDDIFLLENKKEIFAKIANDASAKRFDAHLDKKKNITVGRQSQGTFEAKADAQTQQTEVAKHFFAN